MIKILLFVCIMPFFIQDEQKQIDPEEKRFELEGSVMYTSFSQGGARRADDMMNIEYPKVNFTFFIVQYFGPDLKPKLVQKVKTNENGIFKIELKPGKYGVVLNDKKLKIGQFLPFDYHNRGDHYSEFSTWMISTEGPFEIVDQDLMGLKIVNHKRSICLDCP